MSNDDHTSNDIAYRLVNVGGNGGNGPSTVGRELSAGALMVVDTPWSSAGASETVPSTVGLHAAAAVDGDDLFLAVAAATA